MPWRLLELLKLGEESLHESLHLAVAIGIFLPVEYCKHGRHSDRVRYLTRRNECGVFLGRKFAKRIVILKVLGERDRHQVKSGICRDFREEIDRLVDHANKRRDFSGFELLQRQRIVVIRRLDLYAHPLKHDRAGQARGATLRSEIDLLAP